MPFPGTPAPICSQEEGKGFARLGSSKLYRIQPGSCKMARSHHLQETSFCKSLTNLLSFLLGMASNASQGKADRSEQTAPSPSFISPGWAARAAPLCQGRNLPLLWLPFLLFHITLPSLIFFLTYWNNLRETHPGIKKPGGTITAIPRASWLLSSPQASEKIRVSQHKSWARLCGADTGARFQLKLIQAR